MESAQNVSDDGLPAAPVAAGLDTRRRKAKVRQHKLGHFIIRNKGKDVYLGLNFSEAQHRAIQLFGPNKVILQAQSPKVNSAGNRRWVNRSMQEIERNTKPVTVLKGRTFNMAAGLLLNTMGDEQVEGRKHLRKTLGAFLAVYGEKSIHSFRPEDLLKFRAVLTKGYSPKTQNHHVASVRRLLTFIYELQWVEVPFRLGALKAARLPPAPDKALPVAQIREILTAVGERDLNLARWLLLQFYTVGRTTEMPKLVGRKGTFEPKYPYVFRLTRGKTDLQTGEPTRIVLIPEAMRLLEVIEPAYSTEDRYQKACRRLRGELPPELQDWSPGLMRPSASTCLSESPQQFDESLIRAAEHHAQEKVIRVYRPPPFAKVRECMAALAAAVSLSTVNV